MAQRLRRGAADWRNSLLTADTTPTESEIPINWVGFDEPTQFFLRPRALFPSVGLFALTQLL